MLVGLHSFSPLLEDKGSVNFYFSKKSEVVELPHVDFEKENIEEKPLDDHNFENIFTPIFDDDEGCQRYNIL